MAAFHVTVKFRVNSVTIAISTLVVFSKNSICIIFLSCSWGINWYTQWIFILVCTYGRLHNYIFFTVNTCVSNPPHLIKFIIHLNLSQIIPTQKVVHSGNVMAEQVYQTCSSAGMESPSRFKKHVVFM